MALFSPQDERDIDMILYWAMATLTSAERTITEGPTSPWPHNGNRSQHIRSADAGLMVLAMRNLLRAATFVGRHLQARQDFDLAGMLNKFDAMVPGAVNARDALEHFDEYAVGRGRLQRAHPVPFDFRLDDTDDGPTVYVGPIQINVIRAQAACRWLIIQVLAAVPNGKFDTE